MSMNIKPHVMVYIYEGIVEHIAMVNGSTTPVKVTVIDHDPECFVEDKEYVIHEADLPDEKEFTYYGCNECGFIWKLDGTGKNTTCKKCNKEGYSLLGKE